MNENKVLNKNDLDFDNMERMISQEIEDSLSDLELLESDRQKIDNPEVLAKTIGDEIWKQFANQIGLEVTSETLIQKYNKEHSDESKNYNKDEAQKIMNDSSYKEANKKMGQSQKDGTLKDEYTGKTMSKNKNRQQSNLDHVVSRKKIYDNQRRKQANKTAADLANMDENLAATNESLNKSKGAKDMDDFIDYLNKTKENRKKKYENQCKKIDDDPNKSEADKQAAKQKLKQKYDDMNSADEDRMRKKKKDAEGAINREIFVGASKETAKKAGKDALKAMAVSALFTMMKEILNALIRFFKEKEKTFKWFIEEIKKAIHNFLSKINSFVKTGTSTVIGTIVTEIIGPVLEIFRKLASILKQGIFSLREAIQWLKNKENKNKPIVIKVAEIGKIVTAGLSSVSAIVMGETFIQILSKFPLLQIEIPLLGSLASILGLFLASLISGIIGAIVINKIDEFIADRLKRENNIQRIEKGNEILEKQQLQSIIVDMKNENKKREMNETIRENHEFYNKYMKKSIESILDDEDEEIEFKDDKDEPSHLDSFELQDDILDSLLKGE